VTRVGPAGWSYKDWWGIVYPAKKPGGFHEATFLARYFDTVEINVSFYRPLVAKTSAAWVERVRSNSDFRFTAKLWRGFTHERNASASDRQMFLDGIAPLLESGRLGALLLQFPWSFRNTDENRDYVAQLADQFAEMPLVLEVRHGSWSEAGTLDFLEQRNIGLCNIDQPLFKRSVAPSALTTSAVGYVRLHGRNYKSWFTENKFAGERYNYLYSVEELEPWLDRIKTVEQSAQDTYVVTNNHYLGKAVVNAFEMLAILRAQPLPMPPQLLERYPELKPFAEEERKTPEQSSFDLS
jgi:uncharacterized protein YecE (DUF72 family)